MNYDWINKQTDKQRLQLYKYRYTTEYVENMQGIIINIQELYSEYINEYLETVQ